MLYGIRPAEQERLAEAGHQVRGLRTRPTPPAPRSAPARRPSWRRDRAIPARRVVYGRRDRVRVGAAPPLGGPNGGRTRPGGRRGPHPGHRRGPASPLRAGCTRRDGRAPRPDCSGTACGRGRRGGTGPRRSGRWDGCPGWRARCPAPAAGRLLGERRCAGGVPATPYLGRCTVLGAAGGTALEECGGALGWDSFVADLKVGTVPGDHYSIMRSPHVHDPRSTRAPSWTPSPRLPQFDTGCTTYQPQHRILIVEPKEERLTAALG